MQLAMAPSSKKYWGRILRVLVSPGLSDSVAVPTALERKKKRGDMSLIY